jgi:hypothetical protein
MVFTVRKYKNMCLLIKSDGKMLSDAVESPIRDYIPISIEAASRLSIKALYIPLQSKQKPVVCSSEQTDGHLKFVKCQQSID